MLLTKIVRLESVNLRKNVKNNRLSQRKQKNYKGSQNRKRKNKLCFKQEKISQMMMVQIKEARDKMVEEEMEAVQIVEMDKE
jgi:hypothetical protein